MLNFLGKIEISQVMPQQGGSLSYIDVCVSHSVLSDSLQHHGL